MENNIRDDAARWKKALFLTQATYAKLKDLASPTLICELTLDEKMRHLEGQYHPQMIEIAKRFKFFKRSQAKSESATESIAALRRLAKTYSFK